MWPAPAPRYGTSPHDTVTRPTARPLSTPAHAACMVYLVLEECISCTYVCVCLSSDLLTPRVSVWRRSAGCSPPAEARGPGPEPYCTLARLTATLPLATDTPAPSCAKAKDQDLNDTDPARACLQPIPQMPISFLPAFVPMKSCGPGTRDRIDRSPTSDMAPPATVVTRWRDGLHRLRLAR